MKGEVAFRMGNLTFLSSYYRKAAWYEEPIVFKDLCTLFENANRKLMSKDKDLFGRDSSETCICGALMARLKSELWGTPFKDYNIDIEYNRNLNGLKRIYTDHEIPIRCDLIVHSRGRFITQDNLISIEMKKEYRNQEEKQQDRNRLIALTSPSYNDTWVFNGTELPEFVCHYILGIYYEIRTNGIHCEYYRHGNWVKE